MHTFQIGLGRQCQQPDTSSVRLYKHNGEWRRCAGFGEKEEGFVPAEASGRFADGGWVPGTLELGGPATKGEGV